MVQPAWSQQPIDAEPLRACVGALTDALQSAMIYSDYPQEARDADWTGTVQIGIAIDRYGVMGQSDLVKSSGVEPLDDAGLSAARRTFPQGSLAPVKCRLRSSFTVTLSVDYKFLPDR